MTEVVHELSGRTALLIPAYMPAAALVGVVESVATARFLVIYVVDDGSGPEFGPVFDRVAAVSGVRLLRHAVNLGKGAALKTGMNQALVEFPELQCVVTADADGQHAAEDILRVASESERDPGALVLGSRAFSGPVPLRSRIGNMITLRAMKFVAGQRLSDTQTGLRAIPRALAEKMLTVTANGYEFELEMLIAARQLAFPVREVAIRTIYEAGNPSSHFDPLRDSMRIYFVLLRFAFISLLTACLDNLVFIVLYRLTRSMPASLVGARLLALTFNYGSVRNAVFLSREQHRVALPRYVLLAAAHVTLAWTAIFALTEAFSIGTIAAKIAAESILFPANFAIQRDLIFARRSR